MNFQLVFQVHLDVLEIDPAIVRVAKDQFEFKETERLKVVVGDGLKYIEEVKGMKYIGIYFHHFFIHVSFTRRETKGTRNVVVVKQCFIIMRKILV